MLIGEKKIYIRVGKLWIFRGCSTTGVEILLKYKGLLLLAFGPEGISK